MNRFRRAVLWATLIAIVLLALLSVYGAFLGAERAQAFFNSLPLAVYWFAVLALLIAGLFLFRRLIRVPSLLLMHLGPILVLIGAMWGSQPGRTIRSHFFEVKPVREGQMGIYEGMAENRVQVADTNDLIELPFRVALKDFRMEYYDPGYLTIQDRQGRNWRLPAEPGAEILLGEGLGTVRVQSVFQNFKIGRDGQGAYDAPGGSNPAVEVAIEKPDGTTTTRFVFERFPGHPHPEDQVFLTYRLVVSDYISELEIVEDGQVVAAKDIEVNHPLHYGGYHFYQHSYGQDRGREYTVLMVVADTGLSVVYAGYILLVGGMCWHFWGRRAVAGVHTRRQTTSEPTETSSAPEPQE